MTRFVWDFQFLQTQTNTTLSAEGLKTNQFDILDLMVRFTDSKLPTISDMHFTLDIWVKRRIFGVLAGVQSPTAKDYTTVDDDMLSLSWRVARNGSGRMVLEEVVGNARVGANSGRRGLGLYPMVAG